MWEFAFLYISSLRTATFRYEYQEQLFGATIHLVILLNEEYIIQSSN